MKKCNITEKWIYSFHWDHKNYFCFMSFNDFNIHVKCRSNLMQSSIYFEPLELLINNDNLPFTRIWFVTGAVITPITKLSNVYVFVFKIKLSNSPKVKWYFLIYYWLLFVNIYRKTIYKKLWCLLQDLPKI